MDAYKEFRGKTLDLAIEEACRFYGTEREKLEIEIVNDAKTGIFGLVGARKATIRARRMQVNVNKNAGKGADKRTERKPEKRQEKRTDRSAPKKEAKAPKEDRKAPRKSSENGERGETRSERAKPEGKQERRPRKKQERKPRPQREAVAETNSRDKRENEEESFAREERRDFGRERSRRPRRPSSRPRRGEQQNSERFATSRNPEREDREDVVQYEPIPEANLAELDQNLLLTTVTETVKKLIIPVIGEIPVEAAVEGNRVKVAVLSGENSGLLIGREGQTLAAFQYLANRIVAKEMGAAVRIQLDTGDYRERQDDKLRDIALHLSNKAKDLGKPQSTRPLSSYHRRIVHLALQDDDEIITRSKGDGPLKRVIIARKRRSAQS